MEKKVSTPEREVPHASRGSVNRSSAAGVLAQRGPCGVQVGQAGP
jgi:hypothetical protein